MEIGKLTEFDERFDWPGAAREPGERGLQHLTGEHPGTNCQGETLPWNGSDHHAISHLLACIRDLSRIDRGRGALHCPFQVLEWRMPIAVHHHALRLRPLR